MKNLVFCLLFGMTAVAVASPGGGGEIDKYTCAANAREVTRGGRRGGGQQQFQEFLARPICQCDALQSCVNEKKAAADACKSKPECTAELANAGADVDAVRQCFEHGKDAHSEFRQCMEAELGKKCDDGSGTITEPEIPTGRPEGGRGGNKGRSGSGGQRGGSKGRGGGKGRGGKRGGRGGRHGGLVPQPVKNYKKCVHQCIKGDPDPQEGDDSRKSGGHRKRGGQDMGCMKELECRPVMHSREAKQAAMETCKASVTVDKSAKFTRMCECLKSAGFGDLDCTAPTGKPTWQRRGNRRGGEEDSSE